MKTSNEIKAIIQKAKNVAIFGHTSPDPDCYGALFSAKYLCEKLGCEAHIFGVNTNAEYLKEIFDYSQVENEFSKNDFDLVILVDANDVTRLDEKFQDDVKSMSNILVLDHHPLLEEKSGICYHVDTGVCSASMIIGQTMRELNIEPTSEIATYIFAGIVGDTGRFCYSVINRDLFEYVAYLQDFGVDIQRVYNALYYSKTQNQLKIQKFILNNFKVINRHYCYVIITQKDLNKAGVNTEDVKVFIDTLRDVREFYMLFFCYEKQKGQFNVSCRSKGNYDVSAIARKFGGGGHKAASMFSLEGGKHSVEKKLISICEGIEA